MKLAQFIQIICRSEVGRVAELMQSRQSLQILLPTLAEGASPGKCFYSGAASKASAVRKAASGVR